MIKCADVCSSHTSGDRPLSPGTGEEQGDDVLEGQPPRKKVTTQYMVDVTNSISKTGIIAN